jgi:uncharacterized protein (TIGR02996 family)
MEDVMAKKKPPTGMRQALEEALVDEPDDLASHMAHADWLGEQDDPRDRGRSEFIQTQISLEDESLQSAERRKLRAKETRLLKKHQREWLGGLAPFLLDGYATEDEVNDENSSGVRVRSFGFRRGWLDNLHLEYLSLSLARVLRQAPEARLLRTLVVEHAHDDYSPTLPTDGVPEGGDGEVAICPLVGSPVLANVRHLQLGADQGDEYENFRCDFYSGMIVPLLRGMLHLEELRLFVGAFDLTELFGLRTLADLRLLQVYHVNQVHRLDILAKNSVFENLTHLYLHPHCLAWHRNAEIDEGFLERDGYIPLSMLTALLRSRHLPNLTHLRLRMSSMGDSGCKQIVESGILKRLQSLDLRHGCITDEGARLLAECPDVRGLKWLDLDRNGLTADGIAQVKGLGIPVRVDNQQTEREQHPPPESYEEPRYLCEGEFE